MCKLKLLEAQDRFKEFNGLFAQIPMRQHSKVQEYVPGNFQKLTQEEREDWLEFQCELFDEEIKSFYKETESFVDELSKYLKKVTRRWASWNHKNFGPVISIEQVNELLVWESTTQQKFPASNQSDRDNNLAGNLDNPLKRFGDYCDYSKNLLHIFRIDVYRPLCDNYSEDDSDNQVPKALERVVQKWEALLHFSPLNEKLFNNTSSIAGSRDKLISTSFRNNRISESDIVVRLIPDLHQKKVEVLRLATKWRLVARAKVTQRRGTYTLPSNPLKQREEMPRLRVLGISRDIVKNSNKSETQNYDSIQDELAKTKMRYTETCEELRVTQDTCERYEGELILCKNECNSLREQLQQMGELRKSIEIKVSDSLSSSGTLLQEVNNNLSHDPLWEKELERIKAKYGRQRLKFMNARKLVGALHRQLEMSQQRCSQLQSRIDKDSLVCKSLEQQLNSARKNIQTQGNMVDALQSQCYTLKQKLDDSNNIKTELHSELSNAIDHCKTIETDLKHSKTKCKQLTDENLRRRSREEELERENKQLRKFIEQSGLRRKSNDVISLPSTDSTTWRFALNRNNIELSEPRSSPNKTKECFFPDINAGRSF